MTVEELHHANHRLLSEISATLKGIHAILEKFMPDTIADLDASISDLTAEVAALVPAIKSSIVAQNALINALSTAGAAKDLTPEVTNLRAAQADLISAVTSIAGQTTADQSAFNASNGSIGNTSTGSLLPLTFANTPPIAVDAHGETLYAFSGTDAIDTSAWTLSGQYVDHVGGNPTGVPLYTFTGDTAPGQVNGIQAGWSTVPQ